MAKHRLEDIATPASLPQKSPHVTMYRQHPDDVPVWIHAPHSRSGGAQEARVARNLWEQLNKTRYGWDDLPRETQLEWRRIARATLNVLASR